MNIILATMIKNEEKTIRRMLDSCCGVATHFVVVDTGSTDNTIEVATSWLREKSLPGEVVSTKFVDFGQTRTETVELAKSYATREGLSLDDSYLLLLDADMILENHGFKPEHLVGDITYVNQYNGGLEYANTRLVKASVPIKYSRRTHEFVDVLAPHTTARCSTLKILDVGDGGCKADKFERDERLLKLDLADNPKDARTMYYLASTYESLGKNKAAVDMYTRRMSAGDWDEEAWMAHYRRGSVRLNMGNRDGAETDFADSWVKRPWRLEPLAKLCQIYLDTNRQYKACVLAKMALAVPFPKNDALFVERGCYHDEFHKILMIGDFYANREFDGAAHANHLILTKGSRHRENALQNATWYISTLPVKRTVDLDKLIDLKHDWHACNPSVIRTRSGFYDISLRTVNYTIRDDGGYNYPGFVATETYHVRLDEQLKRVKEPVLLQNPTNVRDGAHILGIEDVRLLHVDDDTNTVDALGTRCDGEIATPQIYRCTWRSGSLTRCEKIVNQDTRTEKNWLPFYYNGNPSALYSTGPRTVLINLDNNTALMSAPSAECSDFRGGAAPIMFDGGWLWVIHQYAIRPGLTRRIYMHRFVWTNDFARSRDLFISPLFCFKEPTIEFCAGMCHGGPNELFLTYGVLDNTAHLAVVSHDTVRSLIGRQ